MTVAVLFDDTCGFSNRARHGLDALENADLVWKPPSLLEQNGWNGGRPVFERAEYADDVSLIALAVHEQSTLRAETSRPTADGCSRRGTRSPGT
jgi:hypothetical protein